VFGSVGYTTTRRPLSRLFGELRGTQPSNGCVQSTSRNVALQLSHGGWDDVAAAGGCTRGPRLRNAYLESGNSEVFPCESVTVAVKRHPRSGDATFAS
jgi:hypothetical protein